MRYGRAPDPGFLPVFSVWTEQEAEALIVATCPTDMDGNYYARELVEEQTLENLENYSTHLDQIHDLFIERGRCECERSEGDNG